MSEYTLYIATVMLVAASIAVSKTTFDPPADHAVYPVAVIQPANNDSFYSE